MSNPWEATELFGKMLAEYTDNGYRMGTLDERERILDILKESQAEAVWCDADEECNHAVTCHDIEQWLEYVVADIKEKTVTKEKSPLRQKDIRQGEKQERERIIALLEKHLIPNAASGSDAEAFGWREGMGYAVALIKGENE